MSRIGKKPVAIPSGVSIELKGRTVHISGPKGEESYELLPEIDVAIEDNILNVSKKEDTAQARARHGLSRALIQNIVTGVSEGYKKSLEVIGVGYKVNVKGKELVEFHLGYSHSIPFKLPSGIEVTQDEKNKNLITVHGSSKQLVGQVAANMRGLRPPEPYKGKGVRYAGEHIVLKPGKTATK